MKKLIIIPHGWPCTFSECSPGHFVFKSGEQECLGFKSEYSTSGRPDAYNEAGEYFCGEMGEIVQPVSAIWEEE